MSYTGQIIIISLVCACLLSNVLTVRVVERPSDRTVREGETALLRCIILDLSSQQKVYWYRVSTRTFITGNRNTLATPQQGRLSVLGNAARGEFFLQIRNTVLSDAGTYQCGYAIPNLAFTPFSAVLTVQRPPNTGFPRCQASPTVLDFGDRADLICTSEGGHPAASLTWNAAGEALTDVKQSRNVLSITVREEHNGLRFICVARSPVLEDPRTCFVTLISKPPQARVEPPTLVTEVGEKGVFTCVAFGIPATIDYTWMFNNEPVNGNPRLEVSRDQRTLIINNTVLADNRTPVHCTVTTTNGLTATAGALLRVVEAAQRTTITTPITTAATMTTMKVTTEFFNNTTTEIIADGQGNNKPTPVIIAVIVIAVIIGQVLFIMLVYILHRLANKMMKKKRERRLRPSQIRSNEMEENIYIGADSVLAPPTVAPSTGNPQRGVPSTAPPSAPPPTPPSTPASERLSTPPVVPPTAAPQVVPQTSTPPQNERTTPAITSSPPTSVPPRAPVDKRQRRMTDDPDVPRLSPHHPYQGLKPDRASTDSQYLSLHHYDDVDVGKALREGALLNGEQYTTDMGTEDPDDDGYIYELPPIDSPTEVNEYDFPPDVDREYTFMGSNITSK